MNMLKTQYLKEIKGKLKTEFSLKNEMAIPQVKKIVINMGLSDAKDDSGVIDKVIVSLTAITGQKPVVTKARKSISNFKLTKGQPVGLMVTLRGEKMYSFLEKLINIVLPKVRDFRGVPLDAFDRTGNYNLGLRELIIFPEVDYQKIDKQRGMQITINTTAENSEQSKRLLELMGMPFRKVTV